MSPSTGLNAISFVMPPAVIRPAFCLTADLYQREFSPLYARKDRYRAPRTRPHVGVPYVFPSSRHGEMCRSSVSAILRNSFFDHVANLNLLLLRCFRLSPEQHVSALLRVRRYFLKSLNA